MARVGIDEAMKMQGGQTSKAPAPSKRMSIDQAVEIETVQSAKQGISMKDVAMGGGMGLAPNASIQDAPALIKSLVNGALSGGLDNVANRPVTAAATGLPGANFAGGANILPALAQMLGFNTPSPYPSEENTIPMPQAATKAGEQLQPIAEIAGGALSPQAIASYKAIGNAAKNSSLRFINNPKEEIELAENVRASLFNIPHKLSMEFGASLDKLEAENPTQLIQVGEELQNLATEMRQNGDIARRVLIGARKMGNEKIKPLFQAMLDPNFKPDQAGMTLRDTQEIIRSIKNAPGLASKLDKMGSRFDPNEIPLLEFYHDIREKQISAFPQFSDTLAKYSKDIGDYKSVRQLFRFGALISKMKGGFGDPEVEARVVRLLPDNIVKEIGGYRRVFQAINMGKKLGPKVAIGAGALTIAGVGGLVGAKAARK